MRSALTRAFDLDRAESSPISLMLDLNSFDLLNLHDRRRRSHFFSFLHSFPGHSSPQIRSGFVSFADTLVISLLWSASLLVVYQVWIAAGTLASLILALGLGLL